MLSAADISGLYAIIPTPANPGADRWDAVNTVNFPETARLVDALINDGASGIIALGTTGECATLATADYRPLAECLVSAARGRVPVIIGATALGLHDVVVRLRILQEVGADGVILGLPMWQPCTDDMAVQYYATVSEAFPALPIMVYANTRAFRFEFGVNFWTGIGTSAPTVISAKSSAPTDLLEKQRVTGGRIHFLPNEMVVDKFYALTPATTTALWATAAAMGPAPALAMIRAIVAGDREAVEALAHDIAYVHEPIEPMLANPAVFASYNIQVEKVRIKAAGYCDPGPIRPPYNVIPREFELASIECGRRWASLRDRLTSRVTA
jgi:trans-o-hydroxybenzylidenepyruvate hydratase-aldolase